MWDAHCHLDDPRFADDRDAVIEKARSCGVRRFVSAGYSPARWQVQREILDQHDDVLVTYGLHPWFVAEKTGPEVKVLLRQLSTWLEEHRHPRCVGLGELGLDRSSRVPDDSWDVQRMAFREQLELARSLELPVVLHVVQAHGPTLDILKRDGIPPRGGMVHGFSGSVEVGREYNRLGLHLSFGGMVTRPQAKKARQAAAAVDDPWLLCETDSPDMPPASWPHPRNEPASVVEVVNALARCRESTPEEVADLTATNASTLFG